MNLSSLKRRIFPAILSGCGVSFIVLIVFVIKGITPFGEKDISYCDLSQSFVPAYYQVYDILHGEKSLFWNWYCGAGSSTVDFVSMFIFSPYTLFFYFVKRNEILESLSILLLLKVFFCAFTMSIYVNVKMKNNELWWVVLSGIIYASSGYMIQYYTNFQFLDTVMLFPMIVLGVDQIIKEEKSHLYIFFLTISLVNNLYMTALICWYIIIYFFLFSLEKPKNGKNRCTVILGLSTLLTMMISAFISLPTLISLLASSRNNFSDEKFNIVDYIVQVLYDPLLELRKFMLYGSEVLIAFCIFFVFKRKKIEKHILLYVCLLLYMVIPIPFVLCNVMWHIGGYVDFPMRFGFMLTFTFISFFTDIWDNSFNVQHNKKNGSRIFLLLTLSFLPFEVFILHYCCSKFLVTGIENTLNYGAYGITFVITVMFYYFVWNINEYRLKKSIICLVVIFQCFFGWYGFMAPETEIVIECFNDIVKNSELIDEYFLTEDVKQQDLNRVKDASVSLNANYPQIIRRASVSGWTWGLSYAFLELRERLGYGTQYTRSLDCGGTAFSDALFHVTDVISFGDMDKALYTEVEKVDEKYIIGECAYTYPFGVVTSQLELTTADDQGISASYLYQNELFRLISDSGEELFIVNHVKDCEQFQSSINEDGTYLYEFTINVEELSSVYVSVSKENSCRLWVNEKEIIISDIHNENNMIYPGCFNNGLILLGSFENQLVQIDVLCEKSLGEDDIALGIMSHAALKNSITKQEEYSREIQVTKNSLEIEIEGTEDSQYLILPIPMNKGLKAYRGGDLIEIIPAFEDALIAIPLSEGKNSIEIIYEPLGLKLGCFISLTGIVLTILSTFYLKNVIQVKLIGNIAYGLFLGIFVGFTFCVYVTMIFYTFYVRILFRV